MTAWSVTSRELFISFFHHRRKVSRDGKTWAEDPTVFHSNKNLNLNPQVPRQYLSHSCTGKVGKIHLFWCRKKQLRISIGLVKWGWHPPPEDFPPAEHFLLPNMQKALLSQKGWEERKVGTTSFTTAPHQARVAFERGLPIVWVMILITAIPCWFCELFLWLH